MTEIGRCALIVMILLFASARTAAAQTITEFPIPTRTPADSIVAGPDGALWFAEDAGKKIGRITTTGTVTQFLIPGPSYVHLSTGVASGPDGALWFGVSKWPGFASESIGRITTTGEFSEFPLPPLPSGRFMMFNDNGITAGPDGALWFTETLKNQIGRITTTGEFSEFPLPGPDGRVFRLTAGPDGALWFAEGYGNKIGRITTAGAITEFPLPTPDSGPGGITSGPDGALWFTEFLGNKIGRITTTGEFSEFLIPRPRSSSFGITVGSDGAVWFTEANRARIGRIGQIDEDSTEHIQATEKMPTTGDTQYFHWERWILYLEIAISLAIIIAKRLK